MYRVRIQLVYLWPNPKYVLGIHHLITERHLTITPEEAVCPECSRLHRMCIIRPIEDDLETGQSKVVQYHGVPFTSEKEEKLFEEHLSSFHMMIR